MIILSHRGAWSSTEEKNTPAAFIRSLQMGFGTETDIRDFNRGLVISHDIPTGNEMPLSSFFQICKKVHIAAGEPIPIALNIKADGLATHVKKYITDLEGFYPFFFDMSAPDTYSYIEAGLTVFTRMSEIERHPIWFNESAGVWLDSLHSDWFENDTLEWIIQNGKRVCIVSPELHGRPYEKLWEQLNSYDKKESIMLCTDYPEKAEIFFNSIA